MDNKEFMELVDTTFTVCKSLLASKSNEYDFGEDRLHSFKVSAKLQSINTVEALRGYMTKHVLSIFEMIPKYDNYSIEKWNEKIHDLINYLLLLKALLIEESNYNINKGQYEELRSHIINSLGEE